MRVFIRDLFHLTKFGGRTKLGESHQLREATNAKAHCQNHCGCRRRRPSDRELLTRRPWLADPRVSTRAERARRAGGVLFGNC
jgi:hypothetical protein